jgi:hypothetical protein
MYGFGDYRRLKVAKGRHVATFGKRLGIPALPANSAEGRQLRHPGATNYTKV